MHDLVAVVAGDGGAENLACVSVDVTHDKIHAAVCAECETREGKIPTSRNDNSRPHQRFYAIYACKPARTNGFRLI